MRNYTATACALCVVLHTIMFVGVRRGYVLEEHKTKANECSKLNLICNKTYSLHLCATPKPKPHLLK